MHSLLNTTANIRDSSLTIHNPSSALNDILDASFRAPSAGLSNSVIALIDVDGFKQINETYGVSAGDRSSKKFLKSCVLAYAIKIPSDATEATNSA